MTGRRAHAILPALALYALSVAFGKGLVLVTLPVLTHGLAPADFVRLDMTAALIEPIGLIGSLAIADTLFRFAPREAAERHHGLQALAGLALALGLPLALACQVGLVPLVRGWPNMPGELALRLAILSACLGAFIELPLAYWRLMERPLRFTAFVIIRSLAQAAMLIGGLKAGLGVDGVLIGNAAIDGLVILALWLGMPAGCRPRFAPAMLPDHLRYVVPVIGGGLAMFALGAMDRWFLAGQVPAESLAHYALAAKLAMALALAIQPFGLWWYPRRLAVLAGADGPGRTARFWLAGLALLCLGALLLAGLARLFVLGLFPAAYHGVLGWLPWLFGLVLLNELASLSNGPAYARAAGWRVLQVNAAGAATAIMLYAWLIPPLGLAGAMIATACGQSVRLALFWSESSRQGPVPYPLPLATMMLGATMAGMLALAGNTLPGWPVLAALGLAGAMLAMILWRALLGAPPASGRLQPARG